MDDVTFFRIYLETWAFNYFKEYTLLYCLHKLQMVHSFNHCYSLTLQKRICKRKQNYSHKNLKNLFV